MYYRKVLNLIINGIPSILPEVSYVSIMDEVLNLIINGIPSILEEMTLLQRVSGTVLNLIINGIPSILKRETKKFLKRRLKF